MIFDWGKSTDFKVKHLIKQETVTWEFFVKKKKSVHMYLKYFNINNIHTVFDFPNSKRFLRNNQFYFESLTGNNVMLNGRVYSDINWGLKENFYPLESSIPFWRILLKVHQHAIHLGIHLHCFRGRGLKIFVLSSWWLDNSKFLGT